MQPFTYMQAETVADAVRAVAAGGPGTRFLAGGTTLYDLMKLDVETPASSSTSPGSKSWTASTPSGQTSWCSARSRG